MSDKTDVPHDAANWAVRPAALKVGILPPEAINRNVASALEHSNRGLKSIYPTAN